MKLQWMIQKKCRRLLDSRVLEVIENKVLALDYNPGIFKVMKDNLVTRVKNRVKSIKLKGHKHWPIQKR